MEGSRLSSIHQITYIPPLSTRYDLWFKQLVSVLERRRAWRQVFDHAGYAVMDARDGREGVYYSQTHVIDLGVLDVPLPLHGSIR